MSQAQVGWQRKVSFLHFREKKIIKYCEIFILTQFLCLKKFSSSSAKFRETRDPNLDEIKAAILKFRETQNFLEIIFHFDNLFRRFSRKFRKKSMFKVAKFYKILRN